MNRDYLVEISWDFQHNSLLDLWYWGNCNLPCWVLWIDLGPGRGGRWEVFDGPDDDDLEISGMREDARSPRERSRSPITREKSPNTRRESPKELLSKAEEEKDRKSPFDSYSASLRLASLETLTGKGEKGPGLPITFPFPGLGTAPQLSSDSTSAKVPTDVSTLPLPDALANLQKTASQASQNYGVLGSLGSLASLATPGSISSPFHQLLAGQGAMSVPGLPKPAELIQQAQALQLLAHLQTMLMTPTSSPAPVQPRDNQTNFQKVITI